MKRKRVVLTFRQKAEILERLEAGASASFLAYEYGIGTSTITDMRKNSAEIFQYVAEMDSGVNKAKEKKTRKKAKNADLETVLYKWYLDGIKTGPITGPDLSKKALELNKEMNGDPNFKASTGWLIQFKKRHGMRDKPELITHTEDEILTRTIRRLETLTTPDKYCLNNVYSIDESIIDRKSLPGDPYNPTRELRIVLCSNATGNHKIPLMVIGKRPRPTLDNLQVNYRVSRTANFDSDLFKDWYQNIFIPEVNRKQDTENRNEKVLLLVNHYQPQKQKGKFNFFHLPENQNKALHPNQQGIACNFKLTYKKLLLEKYCGSIRKELFRKEFTYKDAIILANQVWNEVPVEVLIASWNPILGTKQESDPDIYLMEDICELIGQMECFQHFDRVQIESWARNDHRKIRSDNEQEHQSSSSSESEDNGFIEEPAHSEAYSCLETAIRWFEHQDEYDFRQMNVLQELRELAARKTFDTIKTEV